MIITIARECGCNGDMVGKRLAERFGIPFYDKRATVQMAKDTGVYDRMSNFFRENPINSLLYAIISSDGESDIFQVPVKAMGEILGEQDCVVIGRCGNYAFRDREDVCRVFLSADFEMRVDNIQKKHQSSRGKAEKLVEETDRKRREFHRFYTGENWGHAENYDICLNIGEVGLNGAVEVIAAYIEQKQNLS